MSADLPTAPRALRPAVDAVPRRLVVLSAGVRQPSSTRLLADRLADAHGERFRPPESLRRMVVEGRVFHAAASGGAA